MECPDVQRGTHRVHLRSIELTVVHGVMMPRHSLNTVTARYEPIAYQAIVAHVRRQPVRLFQTRRYYHRRSRRRRRHRNHVVRVKFCRGSVVLITGIIVETVHVPPQGRRRHGRLGRTVLGQSGQCVPVEWLGNFHRVHGLEPGSPQSVLVVERVFAEVRWAVRSCRLCQRPDFGLFGRDCRFSLDVGDVGHPELWWGAFVRFEGRVVDAEVGGASVGR